MKDKKDKIDKMYDKILECKKYLGEEYPNGTYPEPMVRFVNGLFNSFDRYYKYPNKDP